MPVNVSPVVGKGDLAEFIRFPSRLYRNCPHFVPPLEFERKQFLDPRRNPFFRHADVRLFLARSGRGETAGRIAAHVDHNYVRFHEEKTGFFGFFDAVDDPGAAAPLFAAAEGFLRERGMEAVLGPMNFTTNDEVGTLVKGFDGPPFVMTTYNHPYYDALIAGCGYGKAKDLLSYYRDNDGSFPDFILRVAAKARKAHRIDVRDLDMKRFREELDLVRTIYNAAWERNWGFVPMTDDEVAYLAANLKPLVDPSLVMFAFVDGRPAGFFLALPDYNRILIRLGGKLFPFGIFRLLLGKGKIDRIRVLILGVVREYRHMGIETVFLSEIFRKGIARGYSGAEFSWILEDNEAIKRVIARITPEPYRVHRVYGKRL